MMAEKIQSFGSHLTLIARQLNSLATSTKQQRAAQSKASKTLRELAADYITENELPDELFTENDLTWLQA